MYNSKLVVDKIDTPQGKNVYITKDRLIGDKHSKKMMQPNGFHDLKLRIWTNQGNAEEWVWLECIKRVQDMWYVRSLYE